MNYISICSGIEAASVAWHNLGWNPVAFSEIEPFPSAVLAHHWPDVPNLGDMTKYHDWRTDDIQLLVGGTPCQAFSIAGLRKGLADPRGNLTLTFLGILEKYRPKWVVWENVPGVLSDKTGAFGSFLSGLSELGYGWAYRVLDAQHFGVPQRRRRVFVVGCLGSWASAAAVLFESESLRWNPAKGRKAGKDAAKCLTTGTGRRFDWETEDILPVAFEAKDGREHDCSPTLDTGAADGPRRNQGGVIVKTAMQVRRLTPRECERLQGFYDDHTLIPWRGKPAGDCPDGLRYKALGNSMAVPVMRWIGERIQHIQNIQSSTL